MKKLITKYSFTSTAVVMGLLLFILSVAFEFEVFEAFVELTEKGEDFEIDEFIIPLVMVLMGTCFDFFNNAKIAKNEQEKLELYNQMNEDVINNFSMHLTKLLEFRTALLEVAPDAHKVLNDFDRMIVSSFNNFEQAQRRGDIESSLLPLVVNGIKARNSERSSTRVTEAE